MVKRRPWATAAVTRYSLAIVSVGVSVLISEFLEHRWKSNPFVSVFTCAVVLSAWFGGFGPGLLSVALSVLAFDYYFLPPTHSLVPNSNELPRLILFAVAALIVGFLSAVQRSSAESLRRARDTLALKVQEVERAIAERKRAESELVRLNRALRVRSACNHAVTRSTEEPALLKQACHAMVEVGGYRLAWIGYAESGEEKTVRPMCHAGGPADYVDGVHATWGEDEHGLGPTGTAIRTGQPAACNEIRRDPRFLPWSQQASRHGLRSSVALPIVADGRTLGALMVYADEPEAFDAKETDLLQQTTQDLAHGILLLRARAERMRATEALERTQSELARVMRATTLGELTASIAHEVNQPLAGVVTNANASLRWLAGPSPDLNEAREAMQRIVRDGNRASDVIARVRTLLKKGGTDRTRLDVNRVIEEMVELTRGEVLQRKVSLKTELSPNLPLVTADRVQLQQVLLNLIINAAEAMSANKDRPRLLSIRTERVEPPAVRVAVQDTGVGIDAQEVERLFDAFYTTKPNGLGMGLSICRSIVEAHGGRLWATPNDGPGATFQFTLPIEQETKNDEAKPEC